MITPTDIQNKEFSKGFRGYNEEEVDMFLDMITLDLEKLIAENINLKAMLKVAEEKKDEEPEADTTVSETLQSAKRLMDELAASSEKRARALIHNAELDAALIIKDAQLQAEKIAQESFQMKRAYESFRAEYKEMLKWQLEHFDDEAKSLNYDRLQQIVDGNLSFKEAEPASKFEGRETMIVNPSQDAQAEEDQAENNDLDFDRQAFEDKKTVISKRHDD